MNILIIFISYLLGSLPTGFLIGKYLKNIDLRNIGSGSTGAKCLKKCWEMASTLCIYR